MFKKFKILILWVVASTVMFACTEPEETIVDGPKDLDSLILAYPDSVALLLERGNLRFDGYEYDQAMIDAAKAFRLDSNNFETRMLYAEVLNNRERRSLADVANAQRHYHLIVKQHPKNIQALVGLAATYNFQQDFEKTFQYLNEALRIDPKYRNAYVLKGTTYRQLGNMELAKSSYETAIQQDPNFFEAYFFLAQIYQSEENPVCIEYFATALELRPEITEVKYQLAYSKQTFNQLEEAMLLYREMATDTIEFYASRGLFHIGYMKQFNEMDLDSAIYYYKSALKTEPRHVESWHNLGLCYGDKGDKTRALQSYAKALKYNPDFELSRIEADKLK